MSPTVGFTSSNWSWGPNGKTQRCMGASLYYRGGLAAAQFAARGMGGWVAERCRSRPDGAMELYGQDREWHTPDVVWTELIGCTDEDLEATHRARAAGQVVVGDLDDDVWQVPNTNDASSLWGYAKERGRFQRSQLYLRQLAACDAVICSTEDLCYKAGRLGPPVYLIRNAIDCSFITPHDPAGLPVSWIGSTPWRANDLRILRTARLSQWLDEHGQTFYHGGHMEPPPINEVQRAAGATGYRHWSTLTEQTGLRLDQVTTLPNVPFAEYPRLWDGVGVSLIPLEDVPFNRAKSWLKGLESCAAGVPIIVSKGFKEYEALAEEGAVLWFARSERPKQWLQLLDGLIEDDPRQGDGQINRLIAERNDITHRWIEWKAVLEDVCGYRLDVSDTSVS
jgi:hypothetical protein